MSGFHFHFSMSSKIPTISIHYFYNKEVGERESPRSHKKAKAMHSYQIMQ